MKRLHVLYVLHGFPPETWAGTEVYTLELARQMVARGHRVTILARASRAYAAGLADRLDPGRGPGDVPEFAVLEDEFQGLRVLRLVNGLEYASLRETYDEPRAVRALREVLLRERPDLVHFQHLLHLSATLVHEARAFNVPVVVHCHDYWALCARVQLIRPDGQLCASNRGAGCYLCVREERLDAIDELAAVGASEPERLRAIEAGEGGSPIAGAEPSTWEGVGDLLARHAVVTAAYAAADRLVSPSRFLRDRLLASGAFDPERFLFSDNGLRTDLIEALEKQPSASGRLRLAFVGSLVWYKGVELLLRAFGDLAAEPSERLELHIYGAFEPESDEHHALLQGLAGPNVSFHGRFENAEISRVYREIDVLVVPSLWFENSPITIHEAFLARTPVITANIGGMAEYVRDGVDGLHFEAGDAASLAGVLGRLAAEPALVGSLGQDFPEVKSIEANAVETEELYGKLLGEPRERRPLLFYELSAQETAERRGPVEAQGEEMLLLRPGGAADYSIELAGGGPRRIEVEVVGLRAEPDLALGGRVLVDGRVAGKLPTRRPGGAGDASAADAECEAWTHRVAFDVPAGARRLTLDGRSGALGRGGFLRVRRVRVCEEEGSATAGPRMAWDGLKRLFRGGTGPQDA